MESSNQEKQYIKMTETPVSKLVLSLAVPTIITNLITSIYNMADTYFVSQISTSASAAVGVVFALMSIIQAVGYTLGMGTGSYISRFLGSQNKKSAECYASSAFFGAISFGTILMIVGLLNLKPLMRLLGSTDTILSSACNYAKYILIGAPIMCSAFTMNNILRAEGKAIFSMMGIATGGLLNLILDPLFIFTFDMGISGAAVATLISQCISFCILLSFFLLKKSIINLSIHNASKKISDYIKIIHNGSPTLCRQGLASIATALLNIKAAKYGDAAIAAMSISIRIYLFIRNIILGIGQGFQPVAGYNYGAKKYNRVNKALWVAIKTGTIICIVSAIVLFTNARWIMHIFRKNDILVINYGVQSLGYLCAVLPVLAYSTYINQTLQCLGRSNSATFLASCRQGTFYIPLILILPMFLGLKGIMLTQPLADFFTFCISIPFNVAFFKGKHALLKD